MRLPVHMQCCASPLGLNLGKSFVLGKYLQVNKPGKFIFVLESCRLPFHGGGLSLHAQRLIVLFFFLEQVHVPRGGIPEHFLFDQ